MTLALAVIAILTSSMAWGYEAPATHFQVSVWLLVLAFILVDAFPVHVQFRSEASSFSLFEIPLVVGILLADASALLSAVAVGSTFALVAIRHQPLAKLIFNSANQLLQTSATILLFHAVAGDEDPFGLIASIAALSSTVLASAVAISTIAAVIVASERRIEFSKTLHMLSFGVIVAAANVSLGLIAALLIDRRPWAVGLLGIPLTVLYGSYRAFVSERTQREQVEFLYSSTRSLQSSDERKSAISTLLLEVAKMFRAGRVDLFLLPSAGSAESPIRYSVDENAAVSITELGELAPITAAAMASVEEAILVSSSDDVMGDFLDAQGMTDAIVSVLRGESRVFGLLVAGDRVGAVSAFNEEDLPLFETLCYHAGTALENDRLGQALGQLQAMERELSHQATHDTLTGLPNRLFLRRHLDALIAERQGVFELLFVDLDDFKLVNDSHGHAGGDQLLIEAANRITSCLGVTDLAARLGGDEFAIVVDGGQNGGASAQRLIREIERPMVIDETTVKIGCSIGIARALHPTSTADLLRQADVAMYAAKNSGKGRLAHYSNGLGDQLAAQRELQDALTTALDTGQLTVHYQPILNLGTGRLVGAEALVRWATNDGLRIPGSFLAVAEDSRLVVDIDRFVLATVVEDLGTFRKLSADPIWVSVNLSTRSLQQDDLVDHIATTVLQAGLQASNLVLEMTETTVLSDAEVNITKLSALNKLGFRIALDNFGTGAASIGHLRRFPLSLLKLARPLTSEHDDGGQDMFVRAIIELGHILGLPIIAEGIEEPSQLKRLNDLGCDMGQGFLLGQPLPRTEFRAEVARSNAGTSGPV